MAGSPRTRAVLPLRRDLLSGLALAWFAIAAHADNGIHGRLEVQDVGAFSRSDSLAAALGVQDSNDGIGDLRLTWEPSWDHWSLALHYVVDTDYGDSVRLRRAEVGLLPAVPSTWFNLTETFDNHGRTFGAQRIDRLSVGYATEDFVVRVGRQALTWGSGLVFRPMDLFDPFSPTATDTEYKPGADMLYTQFLFADGSDLQLIVVPRPEVSGAQPSSDASSIAAHYHGTIVGHATTFLLARDHGDWVAGMGVNGALGGATWNVELVPTFLNADTVRISALANISEGVTLFDRNATVFAEYFHNGFGVGGGDFTFSTLPPDLVDRLSRGQVFNLRRDFLAGGMTLEVNPLLTLSPTVIADLNDPSAYAILAATYSVDDNLSLIVGAQAPLGPSGSEFGGVRLSPGNPIFVGAPAQVYLQIRRYF